MTQYTLQDIPLRLIRLTTKNPRSDSDEDLDGLAASMGSEANPTLVQFPVVEQTTEGEYNLLAGERRVRAAERAGWQTITCVVRPRLDPVQAHTLRLIENLHRKDLHPLDEAAALKIAWLIANAEAMGLANQTRAILESEMTPPQTLDALQSLLTQNGFVLTHPVVTWDEVLDRLGITLNVESRKKLLGVLLVDASVHEQVRTLEVTQAALRSIGTLEAEDQKRLVQEIAENPALARRARRIARVVRDGKYSLDDALAEAKGEYIPQEDAPPEAETEPAGESESPTGDPSPLVNNPSSLAVLQLLEAANALTAALDALWEVSGGTPGQLPDPWGEYARQALTMIRTALERFEAD